MLLLTSATKTCFIFFKKFFYIFDDKWNKLHYIKLQVYCCWRYPYQHIYLIYLDFCARLTSREFMNKLENLPIRTRIVYYVLRTGKIWTVHSSCTGQFSIHGAYTIFHHTRAENHFRVFEQGREVVLSAKVLCKSVALNSRFITLILL